MNDRKSQWAGSCAIFLDGRIQYFKDGWHISSPLSTEDHGNSKSRKQFSPMRRGHCHSKVSMYFSHPYFLLSLQRYVFTEYSCFPRLNCWLFTFIILVELILHVSRWISPKHNAECQKQAKEGQVQCHAVDINFFTWVKTGSLSMRCLFLFFLVISVLGSFYL